MSSAIPDADRKLSYDCLKCVIQKFEANFRFRLAERLPKIRCAEKSVPLNISNLTFAEEGFELNDKDYRLGIICQYRNGHVPETFICKSRYGHPRDIDQFGFEKRSFPELTPGDIFVQDFNRRWDVDHDLEIQITNDSLKTERKILISLEREKIELERALERVENNPEDPMELDTAEEVFIEIEAEGEHDPMDIDQHRVADQDLSHEEQLEQINRCIQDSKKSLAEFEFDVERYRCKRENLPSPFDFFIQFTKTSMNGTVHIERFNYDKSLMEAWKYLICKILGNRKSVVRIESLGFWAQKRDGLVVCLPEDIKLDVKNFETSGNLSEVLKRVEPILEYPNRPFGRLTSDRLRLEDAHNSKVQNAEVLQLCDSYRDVDYVALCREVQNKKIVITNGPQMQREQYRVLVEDLIDTKGTLGTYYEITQSCERLTKNAMRFIAERYSNAVVCERLVIIPLSHQLQLNVSCDPYLMNPRHHLWTMKIEVVQNQKI
ncbi:unnamed protein product [Caenorhabditis nigoni]